MSDNFQVSPATENDLTQLSALVNSAYRGNESRAGWTHEADLVDGNLRTDESELKKIVSDTNSVILKYHNGNKIQGCVYLQKRNDVLYLGMLSVSPAVQSQGIGKILLRAAEQHAKSNNCTAIEMTVISVRKELIDWYIKNGYHLTDHTRPFHTDSRFGRPKQPIHFVVMKKDLSTNLGGSHAL